MDVLYIGRGRVTAYRRGDHGAGRKVVTEGGVFWVFEHPPNFQGKFDTQKHLLLLFLNTNCPLDWRVDIDFGQGFTSDPTGGAYSAPPGPLLMWRG